jgi:hypothetical protein
MTIRNQPKNYNHLKVQILDYCKEPKSLAEIAEHLGVFRNLAYRACSQLVESPHQYLTTSNIKKYYEKTTKTVTCYSTNNANFIPEVASKTVKEAHVPTSENSRIFLLEKKFDRTEDNYYTRHIAAQRQRSAERSRSRTYVGISSIYND